MSLRLIPNFVLGLCLALACEARAADGVLPGTHRTLVVAGPGSGYFPVACRLHDGRLAVVLRGGAPHLGIKGRLDIVLSDDDGKTWSKPAVVVDTDQDDRNPAFGQAADGALVVGYWRTANYDANGQWDESLNRAGTWVTRSPDGGQTWEQPREVDVSDLGYGSPYGRILTMPDGSMLMPVYGTAPRPADGPAPKGDWSYLYRSTDGGRTWSRFATVGAGRFNETSVLRLPDGDLLAALRTSAPQDVWLARSADGGKTWDEPRALTPPTVHPADLALLPDGRVLLVVGHRVPPFGVRGIAGNPDKLDWKDHFALVTTATNIDCGYPSSVVLPDGRVTTFYYAVGDAEHADWGEHCAAVTYAVPK